MANPSSSDAFRLRPLGIADYTVFFLAAALVGIAVPAAGRDTKWQPYLAVLACAAISLPVLRTYAASWAETFLLAWAAGTVAFGRDFAHLGVKIGPLPLYVTEATMALVILGIAWRGRLLAAWREAPDRWLYLLWFVLGLAALARGLQQYGIGALRDSALVYYALFYFITREAMQSRRQILRFLAVALVGACAGLVLVYGKYVLGRGTITSTGVLRYAGGMGALAFAGIVIFAAAMHIFAGKKGRRSITLLAVPALFAVVFLVQHRSLWLALLAALVAVLATAWCAKKLRGIHLLALVLTIVVVTGVVSLLVPRRLQSQTFVRAKTLVSEPLADPNIGHRAFMWRLYVGRGLERPALGEGFGPRVSFVFRGVEYSGEAEPNHPHNSYVWTFNRMGLPGVLVLLVILARFHLRCLRRIGAMGARDQALLGGVQGLHALVAAFAFANVVLPGPYMGGFFWILMGVGSRLLEEPRGASPEEAADGRSRS